MYEQFTLYYIVMSSIRCDRDELCVGKEETICKPYRMNNKNCNEKTEHNKHKPSAPKCDLTINALSVARLFFISQNTKRKNRIFFLLAHCVTSCDIHTI